MKTNLFSIYDIAGLDYNSYGMLLLIETADGVKISIPGVVSIIQVDKDTIEVTSKVIA